MHTFRPLDGDVAGTDVMATAATHPCEVSQPERTLVPLHRQSHPKGRCRGKILYSGNRASRIATGKVT